MGCWNKTCGLSNLHIRMGDPVYVFVLEEGRNYRDFCYNTSFFSPLLLPFNSEYNDYGGGMNSGGPAFDLIMEAIKDQLVEIPQGQNEYHDIPVTKEEFGEELFFEAVHEDRLRIKASKYHKESEVYFVMFRKDIVDSILDNWQRQEYVGVNIGTCGWDNAYIRYGFKDILADLPSFLDRVEKHLTTKENCLDLQFFGGWETIFPYRDTNLVGQWIRGDDLRYSRLLDIKELTTKLIQLGQRVHLEQVLTEYLKGAYIDAFMNMTRKAWIPGVNEGSQCQEHHGYRVLIAAMSAALDQEKKAYLDYSGEELSDF